MALTGLAALGRRQRLLVGAALAVRVALLALLVPEIQQVWFAPFVDHALTSPSLDPWSSWVDAGGTPVAFPYGLLMLLWFLPFTALTRALPVPGAPQLGIGLGVLVAELVVATLLLRGSSSRPGRALVLLAVSPVAVYASFVHGQLDVVPTALMLASVLLFRRRRWRDAGLAAGLAVAVKASALLLPPFAVVFLLRGTRYRAALRPYVLGLLPGLALFLLPSLSHGYREMVLSTPETRAAVDYVLRVGPGLDLVLLPLVYAALLALLWRYRRANPDIVLTFTAVALLAVALLTPASPGWYLWSVPFLALVAAASESAVRAAVMLCWSLVVAVQAATATGAAPRWRLDALGPLRTARVQDSPVRPLLALAATAAVVAGVLAIITVLRSALRQYDVYRLSRSPLSVAVAGDSGTGKDTLCISLADVFGEAATSFVLGDDYHLYERHAPLWGVTTHLDPAANDLPRLARDCTRLLDGEPVWCRHYDHERGRFTKLRQIAHRELVVVSGLHVLALADVTRRVDLRVFLDMDEGLRRRLKIERDVVERGADLAAVQSSLERRRPDRERFVLPQLALADVVLRLQPEVPLPPEDERLDGEVPLRLVTRLRGTSFAESLARALVGLGGCAARVEYLDEPGTVELTVSPGHLTSRDVAGLARHLLDRPEELFVAEPVWRDGSRGLMQLVLVLAMLERRRNRLEPATR